jgi:5,6-dimethylbenzimidazole synthase
LAQVLEMPAGAEPVGVLCLGPVDRFYDAPMLEIERWRAARPLREMVMTDRWTTPPAPLPATP